MGVGQQLRRPSSVLRSRRGSCVRVLVMAVVAATTLAVASQPAVADPPTSPPSSQPTSTTVPVITVAPTSTTTAPPVTGISQLQTAVVTGSYQQALTKAAQALQSAQVALSTATADLQRDEAASTSAAASQAAAEVKVQRDQATLAAATTTATQTAAQLAKDRKRLAKLALDVYVGDAETPTVNIGETIADAQTQGDAEELAEVSVTLVTSEVHHDQVAANNAAQARSTAQTTLDADQTALNNAQDLATHRAELLSADHATVAADQNTLAADTATEVATESALSNASRTLVGADPASPTILGPSALTADQMAAWFNASNYTDMTTTPIQQFAQLYVSEGAALDVRGDIAFAQAVVETGGFGSIDATTINNFAGIGHCDSCASGLPFASAQIGVDAQIQLLRTAADPNLTTAGLGQPLADPSLAPETSPLRGCCNLWTDLTGKWATDPSYGHTVLTVYQEMLEFALKQGSSKSSSATTTTSSS